MDEIEKCLFHYRKMLELLDKDYFQIAKALNGDILDAYQDAVALEVDKLEEMMRQLLQAN